LEFLEQDNVARNRKSKKKHRAFPITLFINVVVVCPGHHVQAAMIMMMINNIARYVGECAIN
jgi:hypothetical protein